ncbi:uncharacterized protein LKV04_001539 [Tautogolabrus adspersus]
MRGTRADCCSGAVRAVTWSACWGATLAFCLYCYTLSKVQNNDPCPAIDPDMYYRSGHKCPGDVLAAYCWSVTLLLLLYTIGAVLMHSLLSVSALRALKKD